MTRSIRRAAGFFLAAAVLVSCSASAAGGPPPTAPAGGAVITANGTAFDRQQLVVPAGTAFPLLFENREGAPHNVTIYDEGSAAPLFVGEIFGGPAARTYAVPAIPAGTHRFRCDVHLDMSGSLTAG
jgi:plastocyanin